MAGVLALVLTMTLTVYTPRAGGINGGHITANGHEVATGMCACGFAIPFDTVFILPEEAQAAGLPRRVVCMDRGSMVGNHNLDIALVSDNVKADLKTAFAWGRRKVSVAIQKPHRHEFVAE